MCIKGNKMESNVTTKSQTWKKEVTDKKRHKTYTRQIAKCKWVKFSN